MYEDKVVGQTVPDEFATIVKVKMINANKNKLNTLCWDNRKGSLMAEPQPSKTSGYKNANSFEN